MKPSDGTLVAFDGLIRPVLADLRFEETRLKDCMRPEFLFRNGRVWFALSWDWREQYLDVALGHLFWFRDVMPRVVVIGDFSHWDASITFDSVACDVDLEAVFGKVRDALPVAALKLESEYPAIIDEFKKSRDKNGAIDYLIGKEANDESLEKFKA